MFIAPSTRASDWKTSNQVVNLIIVINKSRENSTLYLQRHSEADLDQKRRYRKNLLDMLNSYQGLPPSVCASRT